MLPLYPQSLLGWLPVRSSVKSVWLSILSWGWPRRSEVWPASFPKWTLCWLERNTMDWKKDNPQIQYEWARIPHFYYDYYVSNTLQALQLLPPWLKRLSMANRRDQKDASIWTISKLEFWLSLNIHQKAGVDIWKRRLPKVLLCCLWASLGQFEAL